MPGHKEKLQTFAEIASYSGDSSIRDPSNPQNVKAAKAWFETHLGFLSRPDRDDLRAVWKRVVADPRDGRMLFDAVKNLQARY